MKNIFRLAYLSLIIIISKLMISSIKKSYINTIIKTDEFNSSMYYLITSIISCLIVAYWIYEIFEQIFLFKNQGSKLNISNINIEEYKDGEKWY